MNKVKNWIVTFIVNTVLRNITIGGNCGLCGAWIPDELFPADWSWGICKKCKDSTDE